MMKIFVTSLIVMVLLANCASAQSTSIGDSCKCHGAKTKNGDNSCCSTDKSLGKSCGCKSAGGATLISTGSLQDHQHGDQQKAESTLSDADRLQIAVQKICPVMGAELGSMGDPIKVKIGEQSAYLCCKACMNKQINAEHWSAIQENIAKAQGTCPIMEKPVSAKNKSTVVNGQQVFVCCPPCIEKIQGDAEASLKKVNANYATFVQAELLAKSEELHIQAQVICPVSGEELGSMGAPVKVRVGEEHAFLCCKGCTGKQINAEHWKTVQSNLAKAQGVCPVMGKPVSADMKSTVVDGRKFFVCCPPCIEKIQADPTAYIAKLNAQIANGGKGAGEHKHSDHDH